MNEFPVSVRAVQSALACAYAATACVAVLRSWDLWTTAAAGAMAVFAFVTGRAVPDFTLHARHAWRAVGIGGVVLVLGVASVASGSERWLSWASIVMAYCAGNRFKAAAWPDGKERR